MGLPDGSDGKESACSVGDLSSISALGISPGGGHGNLFQYSCLENPMDRGAWWARVHRVTKSQTQLKRLSTNLSYVNLHCIYILYNIPLQLKYLRRGEL